MEIIKKPTYVSLFSGSGVGCYGFKLEEFNCVATNELITRRLEIQKFNNKCKYESGYICGDITEEEIKKALYSQVDLWKKKENISRVDVVIATPPCQGMSIANHKKSETEIIRNSLVIESIKIIKQINPRFFVFENVPAFMKTICTDTDGNNKPISEAIENNLGQSYSYASRIINFKNYGACSSRQRTVVIGVSNDYADEVSPLELYPDLKEERTLREVIGKLKSLKEFGEIDKDDIYHAFRLYPEHMRKWISDISEGQSAFDNADDTKKPHQVIDGKIVINQRKNADKYTRQYWDKVGPCIHTRNDQLASQNTIHPSDDRVFSIRELMMMMTVPKSFKWVEENIRVLNNLPEEKKRTFLKKEEIKIRQSLGEAVPTVIFQSIARKIKQVLECTPVNTATINKIVDSYNLADSNSLLEFVKKNPMRLSPAMLGKVTELANTRRTDNAAYFTSKSLITEMMKALPDTDKDAVRILEPSVGVGNFIPLIIKKFEGKNIILDVVDIDEKSLEITELILRNYNIPSNCTINYIAADFLLYEFDVKYDYIIGNPPFHKMKSNDGLLKVYRKNAINKNTTNICSFFLDKSLKIGNYVSLVFPKFLLNTPEFATSREYISGKAVDCIIDFGEKGFPGVLVETLAVFINNTAKPSATHVVSVTHGKHLIQQQKYIFDNKLPYWIIYRNKEFDEVCKKLDFDVFNVFRDRQMTNKMLSENGDIRVLKSRNINDAGTEIIDIDGYDSYISFEEAKGLSVFEYYKRNDVYLTPNMTYKPRVIKKPKDVLVNGSLAILIPKSIDELSEEQMLYFSTDEYRKFYQIARNYQTRSLNVDTCSVFFYGLLRTEDKKAPITEKFIEKDEAQISLLELVNRGKGMLTQQSIIDFCNQYDYDIRKSGNGRWIDQKLTVDVLSFIADSVLEFVGDDIHKEFKVKDIWTYQPVGDNVRLIFKKPEVNNPKAAREYDKFFGQPLKLLGYSKVLHEEKRGNHNIYRINNLEVLEYIAAREKNTLFFLKTYIEKVLRDSDMMTYFDEFFNVQNKDAYNKVKTKMQKFLIENTGINGKTECNRIFTKVINVLAYYKNACGTREGRISKSIITYDELMYNRMNFRDIYSDKPKGITRKEYAAIHPVEVNEAYYHYQSTKAKKFLRLFNEQVRNGQTEHLEAAHMRDKATHMHHIFPESVYPEICCYLENIIALTPTQHLNYAHPNGRTQEIDEQYQHLLLLSKADRLKENLIDASTDKIYEFSNFLFVLSVGFDNDDLLEIEDMDFNAVINAINVHYMK